ncbi:7073_t:CDS:2, partial [Cetraspora pellucida]
MPLDLALSSTTNAEEPPYEQQLQEKHDEHVKKTSFHIGDKVLLYWLAQAK